MILGSSGFAYHFRPDDRSIVTAFNQYRVSYIIVGGVAVAFHGCRQIDDIDDLDLLIDPTLDNARLLIEVLRGCGVQVTDSPSRIAKPKVQLAIKYPPHYTDVLTPAEGIDFLKLVNRSVSAIVDGLNVRVVGGSDLIAMKEHTVVSCGAKAARHLTDLECLQHKTTPPSA